MAVRIRRDGRVLCAAMHAEENGDIYVSDGLHYYLSVECKVLVTEPHERHSQRDFEAFVRTLDEDAEPSEKLRRLFDDAEE